LEICQKKGHVKHLCPCQSIELSLEQCTLNNSFRDVKLDFTATNGQVLQVKKLGIDYAKMINDNWKFRDADSLAWIESQCESGFAYGVIAPDDRNPVSWILAYKYGALGLLKTRDDWRGQGCAKTCVEALSNRLASIGVTPFAYIEDDNVASINLFKKLGFQETKRAFWVCYLPNSKDECCGENIPRPCCT
jgi:GNAT superfamily N-acetyltransferase